MSVPGQPSPTWYDLLAGHLPEVVRRHRVSPDRLGHLPRIGGGDTVLLVGSHARGEATPDSDLDLAVICAEPPARVPRTRGYPSVFGDSVVAADFDGLVLNVDFVSRDMVRAVRAVLDAVPGDPASPSIANLGPLELRVLERVGTGIVLAGTDDTALIGSLDLAKACDNTSAIAFVVCVGHLRAAARPDADPVARRVRLGRAAEELLFAEVNAGGVLTFDVKHLPGRARRLLPADRLPLLDVLADPGTDPVAGTRLVREHAYAFLRRWERDGSRDIGLLLRPLHPALLPVLTPS